MSFGDRVTHVIHEQVGNNQLQATDVHGLRGDPDACWSVPIEMHGVQQLTSEAVPEAACFASPTKPLGSASCTLLAASFALPNRPTFTCVRNPRC